MTSLISISPLVGALLFLILSIEYPLLLQRPRSPYAFAFLFAAFWSLTSYGWLVSDFLLAAVWSSALLIVIAQQHRYLLWLIPGFAAASGVYAWIVAGQPGAIQFYMYVVCSIGTLLIVEQFVRYTRGLQRAVGIGIGCLFLFNLYLFSSALVSGEVSIELLQARSLAATSVAALLSLAPIFVKPEERSRKLGLSRQLVFTTTSLVVAGIVLLAVPVLGYLLRIGRAEYGFIVQHLFLFLFALFAAFYLSSSARRARLRVWVDKMFFQTKYDYNAEWRKLSERLSQPNEDYASVAVRAVIALYFGNGGALYLKEGTRYVLRAEVGPIEMPDALELEHYPSFRERLEANWVFFPGAEGGLGVHNDEIPSPLSREELLVIVPLLTNNELLGVIVVQSETQPAKGMDWEDIDLLRMVGAQISAFVGYEALQEEIVVTRQFEAYHRFTTFVMHDLKNLVAQQKLVVENAGRFIDNPEFIRDTIKTVESSVVRMDRLMRKIRDHVAVDQGQASWEPVLLLGCVREGIERCEAGSPSPELEVHIGDLEANSQVREDLWVVADPDQLVMAFAHLISNAQDACSGRDSRVNVIVETDVDGEHVRCRITDNGVGMDHEFIKERLFKPFYSTKSGKGLGIGAYQCRRIIEGVGGELTVDSRVGEGTCFTVTLPLCNSPVGAPEPDRRTNAG